MSKPLAAKGGGACLKHVLNTRLTPVRFAGSELRNGAARHGPSANECDMSPRVSAARPLSGAPAEAERSDTDLDVGDLYRCERARLLRTLAPRIGRDGAEDVIQQAFLQLSALEGHKASSIEQPAGYLRGVVRNLLNDAFRRAGATLRATELGDNQAESQDPFAALDARDRLRRIEGAIAKLKPLTREIFLAHRVDGYSYGEIASRTGLSLRGVEKQMRTAIKLLGRHVRRDG